ncbi:hypothetical protein FGO68_gene1867 [Halteria grandinella]|uniref:Transmembrane protein n=1 Tax=Halteria grandinella TaxID=5974 RepID=A0A8J8NH87_HALGN|nr:hypothetical protein FGO68_gene1867 [Halteria grandinella]
MCVLPQSLSQQQSFINIILTNTGISNIKVLLEGYWLELRLDQQLFRYLGVSMEISVKRQEQFYFQCKQFCVSFYYILCHVIDILIIKIVQIFEYTEKLFQFQSQLWECLKIVLSNMGLFYIHK